MEEQKGDYKIIKNETFRGIRSDTRMIYYHCEITDFHVENSTTLKECLFIDCHLTSMKIRNIEDRIGFTFLDCRISELHIENCKIWNIRFFKSEIFNSRFEYSTLPGMIFSKNVPEDLRKKQEELREEERINLGEELDSYFVHNTKFLFCHLNEMKIDNTTFRDTHIKHCNIGDIKIIEKVVFNKIDLRGSKFLSPDFGNGSFENVKFTQDNFIIEWLSAFLTTLMEIVFLYHSFKERIYCVKKTITQLRRSIKKALYKCKCGRLADLLSSTDFKDIVEYKAADFSKEYHLLWYINDLDFLSHFKRKHPVLAPITYLTSNYMRSFGALLSSSILVVWLFSRLYSIIWANLAANQTVNYFYLSFKIFSNFGIYYNMETCAAPDLITEIFIIFEIIIGYCALGTLLSIIVFPFARRTSLPGSNKKKDD